MIRRSPPALAIPVSIVALLLVLVAPAALPQPPATTAPTQTAPTQTAPPAAPPPAAAPKVDPYANAFLRMCSGCHTIGGGTLTGPDLITASKWPRDDRRVAIKRMEKNVGPLTDQDVDGLADFLGSADVQAKLQAARQARVEEMAATLEPGAPDTGRAIFFGGQRLLNGGVPCFACHAVSGRGGNMAKDLTTVFRRLGEQSVLSTAQQPAFPMMKSAYAAKVVTAQEAVHLVAFFKAAAATVPVTSTQVPPPTDGVAAVHGGAGLLFLLVLVAVAFVGRARRAGVRARMVRDSLRR